MCSSRDCRSAWAHQAVNEDAKVLAEFKSRVDDYVALHKKVEASLPKLSKEATPEEIDRNQRGFASLIASARASAAQGDIFTPKVQTLVKTLLERLFARAIAASCASRSWTKTRGTCGSP